MKKILFVISMMFISLTSFAQAGKTTFGVHGAYLFDEPNNFGVGANVGYEFIDNFRGVAEFDYLLEKDYLAFWDASLNVEYLYKFADKFTVYPLAGIDLLGVSPKKGDGDSKIGLNVGAGLEYDITNSVAVKLEYNYKTQWDGTSYLKLGVVIPF